MDVTKCSAQTGIDDAACQLSPACMFNIVSKCLNINSVTRHPTGSICTCTYLQISVHKHKHKHIHITLYVHIVHMYIYRLPDMSLVTQHYTQNETTSNEWIQLDDEEEWKKPININRNSSASASASASAHGKIIFGCFVCAFIFGIWMTATDAFVPFCVCCSINVRLSMHVRTCECVCASIAFALKYKHRPPPLLTSIPHTHTHTSIKAK